MDAKLFGQFIAQTRKEKNMTQAELAEQINVTDKAVSRWERGLGFPNISTIEPLAKALDLSVLELMRSQKEEMGEKTENLNGEELTELMNCVARMEQMNRRQDKTAAWIAGVIMIAVAVVSLYLYARNQNDKEGRRVYSAFMLGGGGRKYFPA